MTRKTQKVGAEDALSVGFNVMGEALICDTETVKATNLAVERQHLKGWWAALENVKLVKIEAKASNMGFTPWAQLWWMLGAVVFFHSSEFLLALAHHGRRRVNAACKYQNANDCPIKKTHVETDPSVTPSAFRTLT